MLVSKYVIEKITGHSVGGVLQLSVVKLTAGSVFILLLRALSNKVRERSLICIDELRASYPKPFGHWHTGRGPLEPWSWI